MTRAQPKVAAYPFTTLEPVLGTLEADDRQLVIADIPGLIEGAREGAGLGHDFLAHVERTRLLVHVLDLAPLDGSDPVANHRVIERELAEHDPRLAELPRILALSKADLVPEEAAAAAARRVGGAPRRARSSSPRARPARASTSSGASCCGACRSPSPSRRGGRRGRGGRHSRSSARRRGASSRSSRSATASSASPATAVDRLIARHDLENEEALAHVEHRLRRMGVISALERKGFEPGDDVEIGGIVFELDPS